jgi:hypothetical protein
MRVAAIAHRQSALHAPPALVPWAREQIQRALLLRDGADNLRSGIQHGDAKAAALGLTKLREGAAQQGVSAADRDAIAAYDARVVRMRKLAAAVAREQQRLSKEFA